MGNIPVIAIFDVGKTNKKLLLFDEQYQVVYEESVRLEETQDEDGFPCEDILALTNWIKTGFQRITNDKRFEVKAVNFSAYGASFVCINREGKVITPLYNYLKPFPEKLRTQFYATYGGEQLVSRETASPVLGSLNSGLQLYRLKYEQPEIYDDVAFALHLPQYLSYILMDHPATDITSVGCHTALWDFQKNQYHRWVREEGIEKIFAPIIPCTAPFTFESDKKKYIGGIGMHDSSSSLIPYLTSFTEPFVLLSTGTWSISLNPFNPSPLTDDELARDCLCYLSYLGKPVKASRLFAGHEHEQEVKRLAEKFNTRADEYKNSKADLSLLENTPSPNPENYTQAYHQLLAAIMEKQAVSTNLVLQGTVVKNIFVDGGFSQNEIFMELLAITFPDYRVFAATVPQATALGAALVLHPHWNRSAMPKDQISVKQYGRVK